MTSQPSSAAPAGAVSPSASEEGPRAAISHGELGCIIVLTLLAGGLRLVHLDRSAIEHFDEGVYAANFYAIRLEDQFPDRHLYAPPLLPLLIEYSIVLGGGLPAAMWVNLAAGILTVPALWWAGRHWFGPAAGVTAAGLCTFSDVHLLYSRTALTDPLLTLWMVLSVYLIWRSICQGGVFTMLISGLCVAAAWWTKYNGWLPLAIATAGFVGWLVWGVLPSSFADDEPAARNERRKASGAAIGRGELLRVLGPRLLVVWIVSIACWAPYVWMLQDEGGYASVAANHARYVTGLAGWDNSFLAQARNILLLEGPVTAAGMLAVAATFILLPGAPSRQRVPEIVAGGLAAIAVTVWLGSSSVLLAAGALGLIQVFKTRSTIDRQTSAQWTTIASTESNLAAWILSAWFIGLLLTTPLYHPYSRLTLPWLAAGWLMAGMSASFWLQRTSRPSGVDGPTRGASWSWPVIVISVAILIWQAPRSAALAVSGWRDRTGVQRIAPQIIDAALRHEPDFAGNNPDQVDAVFYVLAEPAMYVHLSSLQMESALNYAIQPASDLRVTTLPEDPGLDVYLVVGPQVLADESDLSKVANISQIAAMPYRPSPLVWLDDHPGRSQVEGNPDEPRWQFRLYRVSPQ